VANTRIAGLHGMLELFDLEAGAARRNVVFANCCVKVLQSNDDAIDRVKLGIFVSRDSPQKFKVRDLGKLIFLLLK
jgi:hypothetical protein